MGKLIDMRCDGTPRRGTRKGGHCNYLLLRLDPETQGRLETKCPSCNTVRLWLLSGVSV